MKINGEMDFIENEEMSFTFTNDEGEEVNCDVLFTYEDEETGKNYIAYTDNTTDEDGSLTVYASRYESDGNQTQLFEIETEEEWDMIDSILTDIQDELDAEAEDH